MSEDPKQHPDRDPETPAAKKLTAALLSEYVRSGSGDDEPFIASVEKALHQPEAEIEVADLRNEPRFKAASKPREWPRTAAIVAIMAMVAFAASTGVIRMRETGMRHALQAAAENTDALTIRIDTLNQAVASEKKRVVDLRTESEAKAALLTRYEAEQSRLRTGNSALSTRPPSRLNVMNVASAASLSVPSVNQPLRTAPDDAIFGTSFTPSVSFSGARAEALSSSSSVSGFDATRPRESWRNAPPVDRERYGELVDNRWQSPYDDPLSTFSIDVDTASYTNLRRMIRDRVPIPMDSIRIEEMINYFDYDYPPVTGEHPFAFAIESASCPWNEEHRLVRIGLQGREIERDRRPRANLVFLLDVSGSMNDARKLPLVRESMKILVEELRDDDLVSIVVYAGAEGLALPPTSGSKKDRIFASLDHLSAGGSTNGGAGIELAYRIASENLIEDGINRVILCTDGDFNVGLTTQGGLVDLVAERAQAGTFLSVLGFGTGNINDAMLEAITNKGNGTYYYIDSIIEGRKVFREDLMATLVTIAKDVKIQVEFNPAEVVSYRLVGYANRMLEAEDFEDDTVDAGEVGAGHQVTALYEIVPSGHGESFTSPLPGLKYQKEKPAKLVQSSDLFTLKLRYKEPDEKISRLLEIPYRDAGESWQDASDDFRFASAVALFGMALRDSEYIGDATLKKVIEIGAFPRLLDPAGRRGEFRDLVWKTLATPGR